jgi:transcriptional regulator with XRE-family HTH domain
MCLLSTRPADETRFRSHFPGRLRHLRQHLGLTQKLFAEWLGVSRSFLSEVEHGRSNPSMIMLARLIGAVLEDRRGVPHLISRPWILSGEGAIFERLAGPEGRD